MFLTLLASRRCVSVGSPALLTTIVALPRLTLLRALLGTVLVAIVVGVVPAGYAFDRRLLAALIERARSDLEMAPDVVAARTSARNDALTMHATDFARAAGLADAISRGDAVEVHLIAERARQQLGSGQPLVVTAAGRVLAGPRAEQAWLAETRDGKTAVSVGMDSTGLYTVALAPVLVNGKWAGAAGIADPIDARAADVLARLTRSDVTILVGVDDSVAVTTLDSANARRVRALSMHDPTPGRAREIGSFLAVVAPLGASSHIVFSRDRAAELLVVPQLRRVALVSAIVAVGVALLLGTFLAAQVTRPARELAHAATAMAGGAFDAPLPASRIDEVTRIAEQFRVMRSTLARQMKELRDANDALADRNARLTTLQADLMQRDRLAATGRLVGQLAHEIRNPVANLRNLLELIRRRVGDDPVSLDYAELAIDELLRMHELAEQMLDLNRPRDPGAQRCDPVAVAGEVTRLAIAGAPDGQLVVDLHVPDGAAIGAAISPDALKQVLVNLVQNAVEAVREAGMTAARIAIDVGSTETAVTVTVTDNGPGVPLALRTRVFDPFFTTKNEVDGVGLGLFVAEGLVRSAGGRMTVQDSPGGATGAQFIIELAREGGG